LKGDEVGLGGVGGEESDGGGGGLKRRGLDVGCCVSSSGRGRGWGGGGGLEDGGIGRALVEGAGRRRRRMGREGRRRSA